MRGETPLAVVKILAGYLGDMIPNGVRSILSINAFLLYNANDRTLLMPVIVTGNFQKRLINSQANYFQQAKF